MDNPQKPVTRPSGIPRLSRLPLPTSAASKSIRPSPSREKLQTDPGLVSGRLRRPSQEPVFKKPLPKYKSPTTFQNGLQQRKDTLQAEINNGGEVESDATMDANSEFDNDSLANDAEIRGRTRPSLSERTMATLSQIPPSPAPSSRQSSFFNSTSPMRSPSRPPSAFSNYSRSPSRSSSTRQPSGGEFLARPPSAMRLPSRSRPPLSANGVAAESTPRAGESPSRLKKPSIKTSVYGDATPTKSNPRPAFGKQSTGPLDSDMGLSQQSLQVKKTRKVPSKVPSESRSSSIVSRSPSAKSTTSEWTPEQQSEMETRKVSKSSSALRESIARAKAARKAAAQPTSQPSSVDTWKDLDVQDPFNQQPKDQNKGLMRKRLEAGRTSGHLNIAAMSLAEFPEEVMTMYDFDPNASAEWYESVDLVKFIAADNEFVELPDSAFPDIDLQDIDPDSDETGNQFGGLELLDLHGNLLRTLPMGFRRLQRLHTLNLSGNKLGMEDINIVMDMESLRDLKLAKNQLQGALTSDISRLKNLEILDLHENSITSLPEEFSELKSLRVLNVGNNQLSSLPFEALSKLSLKDLHAPRNKLNGTLIPSSVHKIETLQNLDVVSNALTRLSEHENFELPNLQTLAISVNRIQTLPNVSSWQALLTLSAEDNKLSELPQGLVGLKGIRNIDFTGNDLSKLDERIGLMENLVTFRVANNPLRERKFLSMNTEDIKRDLRNRCEPEHHETDDEEGSVATQFTLAPETPAAQTAAWQIKPGGVLDRSYTEMQELEVEKLERLHLDQVKCLDLQHNELRCFPTSALIMLAANLTDLDLSNNPLDNTSLFTSPLTLPNLQNLNLGATNLTTLDPILNNLKAPSLTYLDISYNRLSGSLPSVRPSYPSLMTLLATDNRFDGLEFEAVQGLQVLDVSNNNIGSLPLKVGLLRAEGSSKNWGGGSALRRFEVAGNSFRVPRWQIVAKGTDAILEWLKDRIPSEDLSAWETDDETSP